MGAAVREALRKHQAEELAAARPCPGCGKPRREDVRTRLTLVAVGRVQDDRDLDLCACQRTVAQGSPVEWTRGPEPSTVELGVGRRRPAGRPLATRFTLRSRPHHRTDAESLAVVYQVKAQLRAQESLHDVAERTEFHSCRMEGGEWLQHIALSGRCDPAGWPVLGRMVARHPGWVLSWE
jgi:hypothetical protein